MSCRVRYVVRKGFGVGLGTLGSITHDLNPSGGAAGAVSSGPQIVLVVGTTSPTAAANKLRAYAASGRGEMLSMERELERMQRTVGEADPLPRRASTPEECVEGLGLDPADASQIARAIADANAHFDQKTQTQRLALARAKLVDFMRSLARVDPDARLEIQKRALDYYRRSTQTDYGREPTVRYVAAKSLDSEPRDAEDLVDLLEKSQAVLDPPRLHVGPRGGAWADPERTRSWTPRHEAEREQHHAGDEEGLHVQRAREESERRWHALRHARPGHKVTFQSRGRASHDVQQHELTVARHTKMDGDGRCIYATDASGREHKIVMPGGPRQGHERGEWIHHPPDVGQAGSRTVEGVPRVTGGVDQEEVARRRSKKAQADEDGRQVAVRDRALRFVVPALASHEAPAQEVRKALPLVHPALAGDVSPDVALVAPRPARRPLRLEW